MRVGELKFYRSFWSPPFSVLSADFYTLKPGRPLSGEGPGASKRRLIQPRLPDGVRN